MRYTFPKSSTAGVWIFNGIAPLNLSVILPFSSLHSKKVCKSNRIRVRVGVGIRVSITVRVRFRGRKGVGIEIG